MWTQDKTQNQDTRVYVNALTIAQDLEVLASAQYISSQKHFVNRKPLLSVFSECGLHFDASCKL